MGLWAAGRATQYHRTVSRRGGGRREPGAGLGHARGDHWQRLGVRGGLGCEQAIGAPAPDWVARIVGGGLGGAAALAPRVRNWLGEWRALDAPPPPPPDAPPASSLRPDGPSIAAPDVSAASTLSARGAAARFGTATSNDYRSTFFAAYPELKGKAPFTMLSNSRYSRSFLEW
jgi:hypothetical protein